MYVITGATGNTGSVAARQLLARGERVRVIGRSAGRLESHKAGGAEPFLCDLTDTAALTKAFEGARAVYAMIPPDVSIPDYRAYQDRVTDAIAAALKSTQVKHVVSLSSMGADKPSGTGPVAGLHRMEQVLNAIGGLNALHLRAGYFMENTLSQVGVIRAMGVTAGPLLPHLKLPMIAARDIGLAAAQALLALDFRGHAARELLGQRDISMIEATTLIGRAIGRPDLTYVQATAEQSRDSLIQAGMSPSLAGLILEMATALNSGYMVPLEPRSPQNTTPTSYERFAAEEFVPRFQSRPATA